ncbi:MAG: TRAP transporter fused permease subunit, partial [Pseudomonadota bacterium]
MNEEKLESNKSKDKLSGAELQDLVIESDAGARSPNGIFSKIIVYVALAWSIFQLWISSPLPFMLADATWLHDYLPFNYNLLIINDTKARYIHLSFALFLAYLAYPAFKSSPRQFIPLIDKIFAVLSAFCALYLLIFYKELSLRSGMPNNVMSDIMSNSYEHTGIFATVKRLILDDVILSILGIILLLEATRRALGPPLMIIGLILLLYTHFGASESIPDILRHKGHSLEKIASHQWLTSEGIFGIALGVSTSFVFLFVLFGALLDKAGAGNYFIKVAFSLLGHLKGGPAKAAVLSSGLTGLVSGSSIANVVTTGTFTVPLMRRVGFSKEKAGAVEVASSVNGQIMPPVMGAAAFLMVEYVAIPYTQVVKHAFIPALISYIALIYIVHLEAVKNNMQTLSKPIISTVSQKIFTFTIITSSLIIVAFISYTVIAGFSICMGCDESIEILNYTIIDNGFIGFERISGNMHFYILGLKQIFGQNSVYYISLIILLIYVLVIRYESKMPDLLDNADDAMTVLPETGKTVKAGLHYLLPIVVLVWCLIVERLSPGFSAFWATTLIIFILLTQDILKSFFRSEGKYLDSFKNSFVNLLDGLVTGARNMVGIGVATAAAGIVVGSVSLTGIGQVLTEVIEYASGGYILIILILTAFICLILGMGLPTTANYIVVASLMANVIVELGMQNGLLVPLIAVHLFVFYFGIMADVTPPVGLASFAAAAVSGGNPIRTGLQAFVYSLRTIILPFFFIFNTEIILYNVDSIWHAGMVLIVSTIAILLFTSGTQGYFIVKNKFYESLILILVSFLLFIPNKFIDLIYPPFEKQPITQSIEEMNNIIGALESGQNLKLYVNGKNTLGQDKEITLNLSKETKEQNFSTIVRDFGLIISTLDNKII